MLRLNVSDYEDRNKLKSYVNEIFLQFDKGKKGELTKEEMKNACQSNQKIKNLIEKNVKILKDIDSWIESDFAKPFRTKISFCAGLSSNSRINGVYYPHLGKLVSAFSQKERIRADNEAFVEKHMKAQEKVKTEEEEEELL